MKSRHGLRPGLTGWLAAFCSISALVAACSDAGLVAAPAGGNAQVSGGTIGQAGSVGAIANNPQTQGDEASGQQRYDEMCAGCHGKQGEGGVGKALRGWAQGEAELIRVIDTRMPPTDPDKCRDKCARDVAAYILTAFGATEPVSCEGQQPGPRQLRLLPRREYERTVRDLFGAPATSGGGGGAGGSSGGGCGSDDDCDVKSESCVAGSCQKDPCNLVTFSYDPKGQSPKSVHVAGSFNDWPGTVAGGGWAMSYLPKHKLYVTKKSVANGSYTYKLVIDESTWITDPGNPNSEPDGFGGQNSKLSVSCAGSPAPGGITLPADLTSGFPVESRPKGYGFDNNAEAGLVTSVHVEQYLRAAAKIAAAAVGNLPAFLPCQASGDACAEQVVRAFGRRAFRRALSEAEVARYRGRLTSQPTFEQGVSLVLQIMLSSPHFLYRSEMGEAQADGTYRLTAYETATALSYTFWATMPDEDLLRAAEMGELSTREGVLTQAKRLLQDPRARETVSEFALSWLGVERVLSADKSPAMFPSWSDELGASMAEETRRFVSHVVFDGSKKFDELLSADYSFVDQALASHYGASASGAGFAKATMPAERQGGLLTQGSVLASYAHSDQSSPIRRGVFVRERLLCQVFGAPPPSAGGVPKVDPQATTRERFRQHTDDPVCKTCHQYIDEVGFAFEHFDATGHYRDTEAGKPIETKGDLRDIARFGDETSAPFDDVSGMAKTLSTSEPAAACFARQYYRYATGHLERPVDSCALSTLESGFAKGARDVQTMMLDVVSSDSFTVRK